ncbi:hypothetical protein [Paractinoplanes toevensis]|uniref:Uncharacterized protein n=1 Tax=Paractinoplanes toevensis TaxID=571911 RepID=A0A919W3A1_9ACTN|nr:hypothetical protein [Actinoplanes toevensis]GIM88893.1 hypothetical protein Ato02nite_006860 [Actinoplanes toevensis]
MSDIYQVVAECAHVTVNSPMGRVLNLLYKGALVPADAPELPRLLDIGFVAKIGGETGGVDAAGIPAGAREVEVPVGVTSTPVAKTEKQLKAEQDAADKASADADLAEKRTAAKAKLPADGSVPDGRAGKDVFVEFLAGNGYDYDEVAKVQDKGELIELAKKVADKRS